jgi:hypothetical protein
MRLITVKVLILVFTLTLVGFTQSIKIPQIEFSPKKYVCYKTKDILTIDGKLSEPSWQKSDWIENFIDITGNNNITPKYKTKVAMLWDDNYFYIGAYLEEKDIWGTITEHDSKIFNDNAFEIFIDPDGSTHNYYEIEINALKTVWDLLMLKPYRDEFNSALSNWDLKGFKCEISYDGTLNNPSDEDNSWSIEMAIPWRNFKELTTTSVPPKNKDQWRVNFLRVEWQHEIVDGKYQKKINMATKKVYPSNFWVWAPQGLVDMHYPEMWGYVQFSDNIIGGEKSIFIEKREELAKWFLRQVYYAERNYYIKNGKYTNDFNKLDVKCNNISGYILPPIIEITSNKFQAFLKSKDGNNTIFIQDDGLVKTLKN